MSETNGNAIALLDLDGTLAGYEEAMKQHLLPLADPGDDELDHPLWDTFWLDGKIQSESGPSPHIKARMDLIKKLPGFWRNLPWLEDGYQLLNSCRNRGFDLHILTKGPHNTTSAWTEKVEWCREHVPDAKVTVTEDKSLTYGKVLVDDYPPYIMAWAEWRPRGLIIMPNRPSNYGFSLPNLIRYDGTNIAQVGAALDRAFHRVPGKELGPI